MSLCDKFKVSTLFQVPSFICTQAPHWFHPTGRVHAASSGYYAEVALADYDANDMFLSTG